jgi:pyridoxine 5-phosphate synthase
MIRLGVNIDHVATLRQARRGHDPDPVHAATLALLGGADGITVHLREDRRHIQERDVRLLRDVVPSRLNLEMAAADALVEFARSVRPDEATLVPERRQELTTEGGLDIVAHRPVVQRAVEQLQDAGIAVSLFIDPDPLQIEAAKVLGVRAVEIQTARYAEARSDADVQRTLDELQTACRFTVDQGLRLHLGHGLNYANVQNVAAIAAVEELNIGHAIVARAVLVGLERAVREMKQAIAEGEARR